MPRPASTSRSRWVQPDGGRALVIGKLDAVPDVAGGRALRIVVCGARITVLPAR